MFITLLMDDWQRYVLLLIGVIFSICLHELAHCWVAYRQGDPTGVEEGHFTLNPMVQMGPISLLLCAVIGVAWGAVPVNPRRMNHRWSHAFVAVCGPLTNLVLFFIFSILLGLMIATAALEAGSSAANTWFLFFIDLASLNLVLFVLNMLPVPPFDGHTVFSYFFPQLERMDDEWRNGAMFILVMGFFMASGYIFGMANSAVGSIVVIVAMLAGLFGVG